MSFPKYPAYKGSGVEWIGEIPVCWGIKPIKRVAQLHTEKSNNRIFPVALENIQSKTGKFISSDTEFEGEGVSFQKGYILFGKLRPYLAKVWLADKAGEAVGDFHVMSPISCNGDFLRWILISDEVISQIDGSTFGAKMPRASWDFISQFSVPLPPLPEQQAIASFLDRECGKIDALIAEQERLIALLAEKRQAVISHAVTKGLNPNAPMKDSGIPWIGMVPEGWTLKPLKSFVTFVGGATPSKDNLLFWNGDIPWVSPKDMKSHHIFDTEDHITKAALSASATRLVPTGNLLIVVRSGILQRTIPVAINSIPVTLNQDMKCIIPQKEICVPDFLFWLIHGFSRELLPIWSKQGATVESLEMEYMQKTLIPLPAIPEQRKIIRFIQHHCRNFNNLIFASSSAITLLKERRAALISAAVTGKIDVRAQNKALAA